MCFDKQQKNPSYMQAKKEPDNCIEIDPKLKCYQGKNGQNYYWESTIHQFDYCKI